jgi:uncharacterized SAM-binding protein YcdF (DUF218 family)
MPAIQHMRYGQSPPAIQQQRFFRQTLAAYAAPMLRRAIEILLLPPASVILLMLLGTALRRRYPRLGRTLQVASLFTLLIFSMPATGGALLGSLQNTPPLPATGALPAADAIVVLSAEADRRGNEYGHPVIGPMTMQRLRYAAFLQRRTGLSLLVSGGLPYADTPSLAAMMKDAAEQELGVAVKWAEDRSADTWENAAFSAELLKKDKVRTVMVVTSAWHMPRAIASFRAAGLEVVAAPTAFRGPAIDDWMSFVPSWHGLKDTCLALHEWCGRIAYWFRG